MTQWKRVCIGAFFYEMVKSHREMSYCYEEQYVILALLWEAKERCSWH